VTPAEPGGPDWQEQFVEENADKYGQAGGQPSTGRGAAQSAGGHEHKEGDVGSTADLSPRGGVGIRETERWPAESKRERKPRDRK
jgi:hypothetical protein